jgi:hypothetical protein
MADRFIARFDVSQDRLCLLTGGQDPDDHETHPHVSGPRRWIVEVTPVSFDEAEWSSLVGRRVRVEVDDA